MMLLIFFCCFYFTSSKYIESRKDNVLCDSTAYSKQIYDKLTNSTLSKTYSIAKGYSVWFHNITYWVANPDGLYATYLIPPPGQYDGSNAMYLRSSDAIIFAGCTPPLSRYYSWDSYLFNRYSGNRTNYIWLFASIGEALNNLVINTTSNSTNAFNKLTTVITTGDKQTYNDIYNALNSTQNDINLRPIPQKWFNFLPYGIDTNNTIPSNVKYDTLLPLIRVALPTNQQELEQYVSMNQTVYYLTMRNVANGTNKPRIPLINETRNLYSSQNINENEIYLDALNQYIEDLIYNLTTTYDNDLTYISTDYFNNTSLDPAWNYGFSCIENDFNCYDDNRDAQYWNYQHVKYNEHKDHVYVIVGINSFNVNLTSYSSFCYTYNHHTSSQRSLTNFEYEDSVINLDINTNVDGDELSNFYIVQYGRLQNLIPNIPAIQIDPKQYNESIEFFKRDYLNPITHTRPDINQMIPPIVLKFYVNQSNNYIYNYNVSF